MGSRMSITLNARLRPLDRGARYETPLQEILGTSMPGSSITGAGTLLSAEREPLASDIDLDIEADAPQALELVTGTLEAAGTPMQIAQGISNAQISNALGAGRCPPRCAAGGAGRRQDPAGHRPARRAPPPSRNWLQTTTRKRPTSRHRDHRRPHRHPRRPARRYRGQLAATITMNCPRSRSARRSARAGAGAQLRIRG